jgi:hypothetical protein
MLSVMPTEMSVQASAERLEMVMALSVSAAALENLVNALAHPVTPRLRLAAHPPLLVHHQLQASVLT